MKSFSGGSWIESVTYDEESSRMTIHTKKDSFECSGVPIEVYNEFEQAPSKGKYFNNNVKGLYLDSLFK